MIIRLFSDGTHRPAFSPAASADLPPVMALGLPEQTAIEVLEQLKPIHPKPWPSPS